MVTATSLVGMVDPDLGWIDEQVEGERFYDVELEWIFATDWMVLAHEHELPGPGDYVTASIGEDPVVVIRQDDGTINAFLNSCRHRGFRICGGASGHINRFVCEHRAWTYERSGELVEIAGRPAVPLVGEGWDLVAVTHIDIAGGWVLASWADDHHDDRQRRAVAAAISPLLPAGDVQRSVVHANWKLVAIALESRLGAVMPSPGFAGPYVAADGNEIYMLQPRGVDETEVCTWAIGDSTVAARVPFAADANLGLLRLEEGSSVSVRRRTEPVMAAPTSLCGDEPADRPRVRRSLADPVARNLYTRWAERITLSNGRIP